MSTEKNQASTTKPSASSAAPRTTAGSSTTTTANATVDLSAELSESMIKEASKELEQIWKGKKDPGVLVYTPVAEKKKGAFVGSIYEKTPSTPKNPLQQNARWLGKLGMENAQLAPEEYASISRMRRGVNRDAVKEKIASDCYYLLAFVNGLAFDVPKARLADLPIMNVFTEKNDLAKEIVRALNRGRRQEEQITKAVHVMSKWVSGYQDLSEAQVCTAEGKIKPYLVYLKETNCLSDTIFVKGKLIQLEGLLELLAASRLMGDIDVLGNGGTNTGFVVQENLRGIPISAKVVKVDPGYAFTTNEQESLLFATLYPPTSPLTRNKLRTLKDKRDIQVGTTTDVVYWSNLTGEQKSRFLRAMQEGIKVLKREGMVSYLLSRNNRFNDYGDHPLMTQAMIEHYVDTLTHLVKAQEDIYGKHFSEILPNEKELFEQLKEKSAREMDELQQALQNKDKLLTEKDKAHEEQQRVLLNQQQAIRNQEQALIAKEQQFNTQAQELKGQEKEIEAQKQNAKKLSKQVEELSTQLTEKVSGLTEANEKQARENERLAKEIIELKQALQAANDRDLAVKMQRNETQGAPPPTTTAAKGGWLGGLFTPAMAPASPTIKPNQALTAAQQVEAGSKGAQGKIDQKELAALLKWVTEGQLVEVEKLIKKNPSLGLGTGTVTDRSERTFKNVTVLQYAAWALDAEMCELIIPYLGAHHTSIQLKALANEPNGYSTHGASYDFSPLVTKTQTYVDKYTSWSDAEQKRYWQKEVGGEQRKCPAWLIYAWSEEGADVAWTKKDPNRPIKREYEKHRLDWWFTENYNSGRGVGSSWAVLRGECFCVVVNREYTECRLLHHTDIFRNPAFQDGVIVSLVGKTRCETLQRLMATSDSQLTQSSIGLGKGQ